MEEQTVNEELTINLYNDGWSFILNGNHYSWDHNDTDMGTKALKDLLEDLGNTVTVEESY